MSADATPCAVPGPGRISLVQVDDTDVINFLLSTEIIPLCLRTMEIGSELSKTVATFIVQKILLDDVSMTMWRLDDGSCAAQARSRAWLRRMARGVASGPAHRSHTALRAQVGLQYVCATAERFFAVGAVLGNMVVAQVRCV